MAPGIRPFIEKALYKGHLFVARPSSREQIAAAVEFLKPRSCSTPLVRIGADGDGGYLLPDDLHGITALFSPGVGTNWSFETDLVRREPMPAFLCDVLVDTSACPFPIDDFWVGPATQGKVVALSDWVATRAPDSTSDLLLQMDIEGAEYLTLLSCPLDVLRRFRIIALELHALHRLLDRSWYETVYMPLLEKLASEFVVVHVHPNNAATVDRRSGYDIPRTLEVTLYRRDRFKSSPHPVQLPHPLDSVNIPGIKSIQLSRAWRS